MKKSKSIEAQIVFPHRHVETGTKVEEICRQLGIPQSAFFSWKREYEDWGVPDLRKLRQLEEKWCN